MAFALPGPRPAVEQEGQLLLAADQRAECRPAQRLEAPLGMADPPDAPSPHRLSEPLERLCPEVGQLEQTTDELPGALGDHHRPGLGERLQAGGQVRCLAGDRLLPRRALAGDTANHDQPGADPDARRQGLMGRGRQVTDGLDGREPGPHRPLGLVLMCARPPEVGEHAVPHELGKMPLEPRHLGCDRILVGA